MQPPVPRRSASLLGEVWRQRPCILQRRTWPAENRVETIKLRLPKESCTAYYLAIMAPGSLDIRYPAWCMYRNKVGSRAVAGPGLHDGTNDVAAPGILVTRWTTWATPAWEQLGAAVARPLPNLRVANPCSTTVFQLFFNRPARRMARFAQLPHVLAKRLIALA